MFYAPKHALPTHRSTARRRVTGAAVAGATAAVGSRQARNGVLSAKWEVHRLQRKVGVPAAQRNGNINDATFVSALQRTLGVSRTGSWDVRTVKALQNHLNTVG